MNDKSLNPFTDLAEYEPPKTHTSGRRELRYESAIRGVKIHAHPKNADEAMKAALTGQMVETLPIRRAQPKVSKKERAKLKRELKRKS
jgi:hypothetical protein